MARARALVERGRAFHPTGDAPAALATADAAGNPSVRWILLKEVDSRGFVFYTNAHSRKGREIDARPRAALACYWPDLGAQLRAEGPVEEVSPAEADAYWATRPFDSRVGAIASDQSAPLASTEALVGGVMDVLRDLAGRAPARPPHWTGFRVVPDALEFWRQGENRLHHRELYRRTAGGDWSHQLLYP